MTRARTLATIALLTAALPLNAAVTALAWLRRPVATPTPVAEPRTILLSGGKMTKALALARAFHQAGHRVVLVESSRYRITGHRFSRAVDRFHTVPEPSDPRYVEALLTIVQSEGVDVYVPVCSPASSVADAHAKPLLEPHCEVLHPGPDVIGLLDDKDAFAATAASFGLDVPETHRITDPAQVTTFDFAARPGRTFVLKSIAYDPVRRLDLTPLPRPTPAQTEAFARSLPISAQNPWILQEFVRGQEFCTHSTVRDGEVTLHGCCVSSSFQVNYAHLDRPDIEKWVRHFVGELGVTGQLSFDFIEADDGRVYAIECNPRTHSAITMFHDHPGVADAYLHGSSPTVTPSASSRPTYWIYHELWRLLTGPDRAARLRTIINGTDAILSAADPLPFLLVHHLQIPWLLLRALRRGSDWVRIDFNIGKIVEPAGD
ncbi:ATP-grasp enzyme [Pseudonocardia sp. KRD291]|uniref:ATP-grasp enzyme n=1 Tax=Pseudonocardia sp. KRD291 TaxID=2792007 RepID=UPI001C4A336B|nr:ATP-grasp enzyme [Pseudonocardia sp. KRD291]MBW0100851.1 ATP-grasp enzyme [Pseudonocardia sp. KRD291]